MKHLLIAIILLVLTTLTGCGTTDIDTTVNGVKITKEQVATLVKAQRLVMGDQTISDETIQKSVVQGLVNQALLKQEAKKEGLTIPVKDFNERYQQTLTNWDTNKDMQKSLAAQGFTKNNMKELLETQMLIQALTRKLSQVSDADVINYYKTHANNYNLYTIKQYITTTEQDAILALSEPSKLKTLTFPANQLPYPIQLQLHAGHNFDKPEVVNINEKTWWVFNIDTIKVQTFEQIKNQITQAAQAEQQLNKIQLLLQDLKSKATISPQV